MAMPTSGDINRHHAGVIGADVNLQSGHARCYALAVPRLDGVNKL